MLKIQQITTKYKVILTNGYTTQNGTDSRACGAVTHIEIRRGKRIFLLRRTDSNGRYRSSGKSSPISPASVENLLAIAAKR